MEFRVLGPVEIGVAGQTIDAGHARQRAVLAVLLLDVDHVLPAETLIDRVWSDDPPTTVRNVLYGCIARLRAVLADVGDDQATLSRSQGGYVLHAEAQQLDLNRFRRLVGQATGTDDETAERLLRKALGLWNGRALTGVDSAWLNAMRDTLELERHAALLDLNDIRLRRGQHAALAAELVSQASATRADERLVGQLMLALYRSGRQAEALRWYDQTRRYLADELGTGPGPDLRERHQQILRTAPSLSLPARATADHPAVPIPRELPPDVAAFTGRSAELAALDRLLLPTAGGGAQATAAVISAVSGTAGVGKTALAVHWAHQAAARFPDGQLHVNLRGYDPAQPVRAADALAWFLRALGVPGRDVPAEEAERAARYRSLLADKRMLIVLDNAATVEQIRPLLPGHPECRVIVTSRDSLAGLVVRDGARRLDLDLLPLDDAVALLRRLIGPKADADPEALIELASQCARLPLALRIAAELAATRTGAQLAEIVAELVDQQNRLDLLHADDDPHTAVRSVLSWSYQQLRGEAARMFRLLGLHRGPDISVPAAASLAAVGQAQARRLLAELARAHLIAEHVPGRYAFHDLLRAYAAERTRDCDSQGERDSAIGRVLDHYLHTAARAGLLLNPAKELVALVSPRPGTAPEEPSAPAEGLAWFEAEHQVLLAAITLASETGLDSHAWQLPWALSSFLQIRGHWQERAATQRTALDAANRLGDTAAQAMSGRLLALACTHLGDHDQARSYYASSLRLYRQLGNRLGEAKVHQNLGVLAERQGRSADALGHAEHALRLYQAVGDGAAEAEALNNVGWCHGLLGDYQQARAFCRRAITLCAKSDIRRLEGQAWDSLGYAVHHLGDLAEAAACYQHALTRHREAGDRFHEAATLTHLGDTRHAAGELDEAREAWLQALVILDDLKHPNAEQVRAKLAGAADPSGPDPRNGSQRRERLS